MPSRERLHERGVAASARGRHAQARQLLEQARTGLDPGDLLARIECSLAYVWQETGAGEDAVLLCRDALSYPDLTDATRGTLYSQLGLLGMLRGEHENALSDFGQAITVLRDPRLLGRAHLNRGSVYSQRHVTGPAAADFERAAQYLVRAGDDFAAAKAQHNLGCVRILEGDLVAGLRHMDDAGAAFDSAGPVIRAMAATDRAEALIAAGLVNEGWSALRDAATAYGGRRLYQRRGETELTLARSLVQLHPGEALAAARRAHSQFLRSQAPVWQLRARYAAYLAEIEMGRCGPALLSRGDDLAEELEVVHQEHDASMARVYSARVAGRRGDAAGMQRRLARVRLRTVTPLALRLATRESRADLAARRGRRTEALGHLHTGLNDLSDWQSSFGSLDLQTNVVGQGRSLIVRGLALAAASPSDQVLFEWSERARMLASRIHPVQAPADPQLATDLAALRSGPAPAHEAELRRRIRERAWRKLGSGEVAEPCRLANLRRGLGEGAFVSYVAAGGQLVALVVTVDDVRRVPLGPLAGLASVLGGLLPDLDVAAATLDGPIAVAVRTELCGRLDELADLLVAPLLPWVGDRPVVLAPSGVLAGVPWSLLPGYVGRPVTVAQSATSWLARRSTPLRHTGAKPRAGFLAGPRVARAEAEIRATAKEWPDAHALLGAEATAAAASALAAEVDVLHVAAHGRHSAQSPLFSGVGLADGPWFGYDIDQLGAVPDIVLLSACEVGRSTVRWGEELIGMTAAWLHAGARCVIASPASVADEAAYDALVVLHRGLAAGQPPDVALAAAVPPATPSAPPTPFLCFA